MGFTPELSRRIADNTPNPSLRELFAGMLHAYGSLMCKERVGEKTPGHVRYLWLHRGSVFDRDAQPLE